MTRRRKVLLGAGIALVAAVGGALLQKGPPPNEVRSRPTSVTVAPAPPPAALPLEGAEGVDAWGTPRKYVDQPGFRSLLLHRRFADLDRYFEQLQTEFEKDFRKEDWVFDAADAFDSPEPGLQGPLDAWVAASDRSFGSVLARGTWALSMAWVARGGGWASEVSEDAWTRTHAWLKRATEDLERAIALRPTLTAARRALIKAASTGGDDELRLKTYQRAIDECPGCYRVRVTELYALRPRWGGSWKAMAELAQAAPVETNPRLKLLAGFAPLDEASGLMAEEKLTEAGAKLTEALRAGEAPEFLEQRGRLAWKQARHEDAFHDFDRALQLRPNAKDVRVLRAGIQLRRHEYEAAGVDLLAVLRVDPADQEAVRLWPDVVQGLTYLLDQHYKARRVEDAQRVADLALELASEEKLVRQWNGWVANLAIADAGVEELYEKAMAAPHDYRAHQLLDYRLARERRYPEVLAMWTAFLKGNPDHGRALIERSGAHWQTGHAEEAIADAKAACAVGTNAGCGIANELSRRVAKR